MKKYFTLTLVLFSLYAFGQDFIQVSMGEKYANQVYYTLENDNEATLQHTTWDLAFSTAPAGASIAYNEATKLSAPGALKLYLAPTSNFEDTIDPSQLSDSLYNDESNWSLGAFYNAKEQGNQLDFGWGSYNTSSHQIEGKRVFALQLRDGSWKKVFVESLKSGVYTFKYADLNGDNEQTIAIDKSNHEGSSFAYFSFDGDAITSSPAGWDLLFTRYYKPLDAGGQIVQYPVTGILTAEGIKVAEVRDVNPSEVNHKDYLDSLRAESEIIGSDWKSFSLSTYTWDIDKNRVYFVKTGDDHLWKLVFSDFEGSSTGTSTFEKTDLGEISAVADVNSNFESFGIYPNPIEEDYTVSFTLKESQSNLRLSIIDFNGREVWSTRSGGTEGLNVLSLTAPKVASGIYTYVIGSGRDKITHRILIK